MHMIKVLLKIGITKLIKLFSILRDAFKKHKDMADVSEDSTGGAAVVGVLDIALLAGLVLVVAAIILKCRKRKDDENGRLKDLKINASIIGRPVAMGDDALGGNFLSKMKSRNKKVVVFYGSQTGTAEEFASRLAKDATRHGLPAMTFDPEDCTDWTDLQKVGSEIENSLVIFCVATYGEGDPTDNAQELFNWIKDDNDTDLTGLNYTVFGLGNKTYEHFNSMGRLMDKRLAELGATRLYKKGEGDDDGCIEEDFVTWSEDLWPTVCQEFGVDNSEQVNVSREYELTVHLDMPSERIFAGEPHRLGSYQNQKPPYNAKNPFLAPMKVNRELHKGGDRSCMHIEMDITGSRLNYVTGDHVAIYPVNDQERVEKIGELLDTDLDTVITLTNVDDQASKKHPFPCPTTYRTALSHYVDITSCPRTNVLRELAEFATDQAHREFLLKITSPTEEGKLEYSEWIVKDKRTIVTVLEDLPSFKPPLDYLLELLPRLQARYYSISSSPRMYSTSIHITAVLVEYKTRTGRTNRGVTTSWLKRLQQQTENGAPEIRIPIFVRHSSLRLPYRANCPVVMVGPGTGVAPFRGFIQDRSVIKKDGKALGNTVLYFGCRHKSEDYLYGEEFEDYKKDKVLSDLHVAFSRDQEKKIYVQDLLRETGEVVWSLLEKQGYFYVCGDARNMARDVQSTLIQIVQEYGKMDNTAATEYIKKLQKRGRYLQDVWS